MMQPFTTLTSPAAPLPESNIDTDIIFPARFLLIMEKSGLGRHLFHERRNGKRPDDEPFVLDRAPYDRAKILVTGNNFGVGSSREHAVWALADFGIRCVIAPGFGEIFHANCFKNGVLPITLPAAGMERVMAVARSGEEMTVDLESTRICLPAGEPFQFEIDPYRRRALLLGLDEIGEIMTDDGDAIEAFEGRLRRTAPWLFLTPEQFATFDDADVGGEAAMEAR